MAVVSPLRTCLNCLMKNDPAPAAPWIYRPKPPKTVELRLFCIPHAGGSAMAFRAWWQFLPPGVEVCALELAGRGRRTREQPETSLLPLVRQAADAIGPELDRPFALFGHSFGARVCFELARELRRRHAAPEQIFLAGAAAPHRPAESPPISELPDHAFLQEIVRFGGMPPDVLADAELVQALLPAIRADFTAFETYEYSPELPLDVPLLVLGGAEDRHVKKAALEAWSRHTTGAFHLEMLPGDHFFVRTSEEQVLELLGAALLPVLQRAAKK